MLRRSGSEYRADAEATLPYLIEEVKRILTPTASARSPSGREDREGQPGGARPQPGIAAVAWDASPISTARLSANCGRRLKMRIGRWSQRTAW